MRRLLDEFGVRAVLKSLVAAHARWSLGRRGLYRYEPAHDTDFYGGYDD